MAEPLELNAPLATETAQRRGSATLLFDGLLRLVGCEPGRVAAYDLVRLTLGVVLLTAAALKGHQLATSLVAAAGILTSRWFLIALVEFEFALGIWLLSGLYQQLSRRSSIACMAVFGAVSIARALAGSTSCGCLGAVEISPWWTAGFDFAAALSLFTTTPAVIVGVSRRLPKHALPGSLAVAALAALLMCSYRPATMAASGEIVGDSTVVFLDPESWAGRPFPLFRYIDIASPLSKGDWNLLFYHHDCPECQRVLQRRIAQLSNATSRKPLACIEVPPLLPSAPPPIAGTLAVHGKLRPSRQWFLATPVEVALHDGVVVRVETRERLAAQIPAAH